MDKRTHFFTSIEKSKQNQRAHHLGTTPTTPRNSPVDEGALGVHEIKLVVESGPGLDDGGGVGDHADGPLCRRHVSVGDHRRGLVVDADLREEGD